MTPLQAFAALYVAAPGLGVLAFCCWFIWRENHPRPLKDRRHAMAVRQ